MTDSTRFQQLLALANEGDETAIADLYREFNYVFKTSAHK